MFTHSARVFLFFFHDTSTTRIYTFPYTTLFRSVETRVAAPARVEVRVGDAIAFAQRAAEGIRLHLRAEPGHPAHHLVPVDPRSEEHTSELQSLRHLVCRLLLEKKKQKK